MVSLCFARSPRRDHAAPETGHQGFVVNGRAARAKGRNGKLTVKLLALIHHGRAPATVRCGLRTAGHRVLPGKPTGDRLQRPWTPHHMP